VQFIKTHLISLICGVVGLGLLGAAIMGMMSDSVQQALEKRKSEASTIDSLIRDPKTEARINAEKQKAEQFKKEFDRTLDVAKRVNAREPLIADVFPRPKTDPTALEFAQAYRLAMARLVGELEGGWLPSESEIQDERVNIEERQKAEREEATGETGQLPGVDDAKAEQATGGSDGRGGGQGGGQGGADVPEREGREDRRPGRDPGRGGGQRDEEELRNDPKYRAEINKARSIRMYIDPDAFHWVDLSNLAIVPTVESLWMAQMSYWIQQDIVNAIKQVNDSAAEQAGAELFVEQSPIKRLERIYVRGYRLENSMFSFPRGVVEGARTGGRGEDRGGRTSESGNLAETTMTEQVSGSEFDVVTVSLVVWMDQRRIVQFIDAMKRQNFYECYLLSYVADREAAAASGFRFGTDPTVRVEFEFEGYFSRALYKQYIPAGIASELGIAADS
jgi:hypothetical protein